MKEKIHRFKKIIKKQMSNFYRFAKATMVTAEKLDQLQKQGQIRS